ncbi:MAG: hypothetical protein H6R10_2113 [Rhodocyclaceae bacterium]|nr:hypothetical protein [Rhodocyclaceae bacterium]
MAPIAIAILLSAIAVGNSYARTEKYAPQDRTAETAKNPGQLYQPRPRTGSRLAPESVQGRPAVPLDTGALADRQRECARLAASENLAERQQALTVCEVETRVSRLPAPSERTPTPAPPATIISCDPGGCWDNGGLRYQGSGAMMIRSDGKVCRPIANMMQCN